MSNHKNIRLKSPWLGVVCILFPRSYTLTNVMQVTYPWYFKLLMNQGWFQQPPTRCFPKQLRVHYGFVTHISLSTDRIEILRWCIWKRVHLCYLACSIIYIVQKTRTTHKQPQIIKLRKSICLFGRLKMSLVFCGLPLKCKIIVILSIVMQLHRLQWQYIHMYAPLLMFITFSCITNQQWPVHY